MPTTKEINQALFDRLLSDEQGLQKEGQDAVNDFIRMKMREDGFWRRIIPPVQITNDELDRQVDTDMPVKVVDKEPNSPAAITIPFATLPQGKYIRGPRFRVMFSRIVTSKFIKDIDELRTWDMDIRQVLSDNAIKDMLAEEDGTALTTVNSLLVGADLVVPETGVAQYQTIAGGITRDTFNDALKIMPSTPNRLETATVLLNMVTAKELQKWTRDEVGGDLSEEITRNGFAERQWFGVRILITIKRDLVADNTFYMFAEPKFLGKFFILEDTTMYIDRKAYMIEFFAWETIGSTIANVAGVARADFE